MPNLPTDYRVLIAIAQAHELDGIRSQILDRLDEVGARNGSELLMQIAARKKALAEERRKLQELWDATPAAPDGIEDGEEDARDGW